MKKSITRLVLLILMLAPIKGLLPDACAQSWQWGRGGTVNGADSWPVAVDHSGNVYGAGYKFSSSSSIDFGSGVTVPSTTGGEQCFWVKYDNAGTPLWAGGTEAGTAYIYNITTDPTDNLIVFGSFTSATLKIGSFTLTNAYGTSSSAQYYIAKISSTGTVLWAVNDGNTQNTYMFYDATFIMSTGSVTTDAAGNIYVTSSFAKSSMTIGSTTLTNAGSTGSYDVYVAKYTPAGVPVWASSVGGTGNDYGFGITVATTGYVYVSGMFSSPSFAVGASTLTDPGTHTAAYIAKFSPTGVPTWGDVGGSSSYDALSVGLASDNYGNVYMTGGFMDNTITLGGVTMTRPYAGVSLGHFACYLVQYSPADAVTWNKTLGSPDPYNVLGFSISMASCGQVWVAGSFTDSMFVDTSKLKIMTGDPVFIAGYDLTGGVVGVAALASGGDDQNGIACDGKGNVFMCSDYIPTPFIVGPDTITAALGEGFYVAKYQNSIISDTITKSKDTTVLCGTTAITLKADTGYTNYFWDDGSTDSLRIVTDTGTFFVYNVKCGDTVIADTFHVHYSPSDTTRMSERVFSCAAVHTFTLTAPSGYASYTWSSSSSTASTLVVTAAGNVISHAVTGCTLMVDTFHCILTPDDTTTMALDTNVCNSIVTLTLIAPTGYPGGYVWNTSSTASTLPVTTTGTYYVYCTNVCSILVDTFNVRFMPVPVVYLGNDTSFCVGNTMTLSSPQPAGFSYSWSTGSTAPSIVVPPVVGVAGTAQYLLAVTDTDGCKTLDSIIVTASPIPVVDLGPDTAVCVGGNPVLRSLVTYPGTAAYLWNTTATTSSITATAIGPYWLQVTIAGCSAADSIVVKNLYDTLHFTQTDTSICRGASIVVVALGTPGMTYQWLPTAGIASSTTASTLILADTSATYVLRASISTCPDIVDSFHLDVEPNPQVYIGDNRFVCKHDTLHMGVSVTPQWYTHYSYSWSPGANLDDSTSPYAVFTAGDSTELVLTVTTPAQCTSKDSVMIMVHAGGFANLDTAFHVCPHDSVRLTPISTDAGVTFRWHPSQYLSDSMSSSPWVYAITSQAYWAVATNEYGCTDTVHASVTVSSSAQIYVGDSTTIYPGEGYTIPTQTNCTSFTWFPPSGLSNDHIASPVATPEISTKYIVLASTEWGCVTTDSIDIFVNNGTLLAVPNAFTPGNGPNSTFKILKRGIATLTYFRVYNRWGNMVYESNNIDAGWDGTYKGTPQPYDVYVYEISAVTNTGAPFEKHGNVTLIR